MDGLIVFIVVGILAVSLLWWVHCSLEFCYVKLARRFCVKRGLTPSRWRCGPAFDDTGVKTEYSIVQLDCVDSQEGRKLVELLVWIFGVRKVLRIEGFPEDLKESKGWAGQQDGSSLPSRSRAGS